MKSFFYIFILSFIIPLTILGQSTNDLFSTSASLIISPNFPEPNATFTAEIDDYSISAQTTSVTWKINGKENPAFKNFRSVELTNGDAGETTVVEAILQLSPGGSVTIGGSLTPRYLDIVAEPQTRTPGFYLGRSLPSIGSQVNLTALLDSPNHRPEDLVYLWRINDNVFQGGALRGRDTISATVPMGKSFFVYLKVSDLRGQLLGEKIIRLPSVFPRIHFYEKNPLYGISGHRSLKNLNLIGNSATVVAEPYFFDLKKYNNPDLLEWKVDGQKIAISNNNPYEITLAKPDGVERGQSKVDLHVRDLKQVLQGGRGQLTVTF